MLDSSNSFHLLLDRQFFFVLHFWTSYCEPSRLPAWVSCLAVCKYIVCTTALTAAAAVDLVCTHNRKKKETKRTDWKALFHVTYNHAPWFINPCGVIHIIHLTQHAPHRFLSRVKSRMSTISNWARWVVYIYCFFLFLMRDYSKLNGTVVSRHKLVSRVIRVNK